MDCCRQEQTRPCPEVRPHPRRPGLPLGTSSRPTSGSTASAWSLPPDIGWIRVMVGRRANEGVSGGSETPSPVPIPAHKLKRHRGRCEEKPMQRRLLLHCAVSTGDKLRAKTPAGRDARIKPKTTKKSYRPLASCFSLDPRGGAKSRTRPRWASHAA